MRPCGTEAAYQRHLRHGEPVDLPCRVAASAGRRERYRLRRARGRVEQEYGIREVVRVLADAMGAWR